MNQGKKQYLPTVAVIVGICLLLAAFWRFYSVPIADGLLFFVSIFLLYLLPGAVLLRRYLGSFSWIEYLILSTMTGIVTCCYANLVTGWVYHFAFSTDQSIVRHFVVIWALGFLAVAVLLILMKRPIFPIIEKPKFRWWPVPFGIVLFIAINSFYHNGYPLTDGRMGMDHIHDIEPMVHIMFSGELLRTFPPYVPFVKGVTLTNYHFMADLFMAQFRALFGLHLNDLFFRMLPTFVLMLVLGTSWAVIRRISESNRAAVLWALLIFLGGDLSLHVAPLVYLASPDPEIFSIFGGQLFIGLLANLHTGLWISTFMTALLIFYQAEKTDASRLYLLGGLLIGVSSFLVAFGGAVACLALGMTALWRLLKNREFHYFKAGFAGALAVVPMAFQMGPGGSGEAIFGLSKGWHLIITSIRLGFFRSTEAVDQFIDENSVFVLIPLWLLFFVVAVAGCTGFRMMGIKALFSDITKLGSISPLRLMLILNIFIGLFLMSFTTLNFEDAWESPNTSYFYWFNGFLPLCIYGAIRTRYWIDHVSTKKRRRFLTTLLALALLQPLFLQAYTIGLKTQGFDELYGWRLSPIETRALLALRELDGNDWLLTEPECHYSAIAGHRMYSVILPDNRHGFFISKDILKERNSLPENIFETTDPITAQQLLHQQPEIEYIFAPKYAPLKFLPVYWLEDLVVDEDVGLYRIDRQKMKPRL